MSNDYSGLRAAHKALVAASAIKVQKDSALERAREILADAKVEAERLAQQESAWIERHSHRVAAWITDGGKGQRPVAAADPKALQAQLSAKANAAAAQAAVAQFEREVHAADATLEHAEQAVDAQKLAFHRKRAAELAAEIRACWKAEARLYRLIGVIDLAGKYHGRVLDPTTAAQLAEPPARPQMSRLFSAGGMVVCEDLNSPRGQSTSLLEEASAYWAQLDRELDAEAARTDDAPHAAEAAA